MEEQNQNGLEQFIDQLIGDRANSTDPALLATEKQAIAAQLNDALTLAILNKLSDEAQKEIEQQVDADPNPTLITELILAKAKEAGLDIDAITLDTMLQFRAFYTGEVLPEEFEDDDDDDDIAEEVVVEAAE